VGHELALAVDDRRDEGRIEVLPGGFGPDGLRVVERIPEPRVPGGHRLMDRVPGHEREDHHERQRAEPAAAPAHAPGAGGPSPHATWPCASAPDGGVAYSRNRSATQA